MGKIPRLTNIYSKVKEEKDGQDYTLVVIEATAPFSYELFRPDPIRYQIKTTALANMYTGPLSVGDGIVKEVIIKESPSEKQVIFEIYLEVPTEAAMVFHEGLPSRLTLQLSRLPMKNFYRGKRVALDPGHGGMDGGHRGPVNLWEKDVVWVTAQEFYRQLKRFGAEVIFTRSKEENPPWEERVKKGDGANLFLSLHTHGERDRKVRGAAVLYPPSSQEMELLARTVLDRIVAKTKVPKRGVFPSTELEMLKGCPALTIETVTITNWVDEGILRNPYFHRKLALAVLASFFCISEEKRGT